MENEIVKWQNLGDGEIHEVDISPNHRHILTWTADIVVHAISYGTEWRFRRAFLPLSGRERINLDLGTIKAFGTIQWFTLVT